MKSNGSMQASDVVSRPMSTKDKAILSSYSKLTMCILHGVLTVKFFATYAHCMYIVISSPFRVYLYD